LYSAFCKVTTLIIGIFFIKCKVYGVFFYVFSDSVYNIFLGTVSHLVLLFKQFQRLIAGQVFDGTQFSFYGSRLPGGSVDRVTSLLQFFLGFFEDIAEAAKFGFYGP